MSVFHDRSLLHKINITPLLQQIKVIVSNKESFQLLLFPSDRYSLYISVISNFIYIKKNRVHWIEVHL